MISDRWRWHTKTVSPDSATKSSNSCWENVESNCCATTRKFTSPKKKSSSTISYPLSRSSVLAFTANVTTQTTKRVRKLVLDPPKDVAQKLKAWMGCCRKTYNDALAYTRRQGVDHEKTFYWLRNRFVNESNVPWKYKFLLQTPKHVREGAVKDLSQAYAINFNRDILSDDADSTWLFQDDVDADERLQVVDRPSRALDPVRPYGSTHTLPRRKPRRGCELVQRGPRRTDLPDHVVDERGSVQARRRRFYETLWDAAAHRQNDLQGVQSDRKISVANQTSGKRAATEVRKRRSRPPLPMRQLSDDQVPSHHHSGLWKQKDVVEDGPEVDHENRSVDARAGTLRVSSTALGSCRAPWSPRRRHHRRIHVDDMQLLWRIAPHAGKLQDVYVSFVRLQSRQGFARSVQHIPEIYSHTPRRCPCDVDGRGSLRLSLWELSLSEMVRGLTTNVLFLQSGSWEFFLQKRQMSVGFHRTEDDAIGYDNETTQERLWS